MTASRSGRRPAKAIAGTTGELPRLPAPEVAVLWLLSTLFILGNSTRWGSDSAFIVAPPLNCAYTPQGAWSAPLAWLNGGSGLPIEVPFWLGAVLGGALIAVLSRQLAGTAGVAAGCLALAGWSLGAPADQLLAGGLTLGLVRISSRAGEGHRRRLLALLIGLTLAPLITLEFGWVWLSIALCVVPRLIRTISPVRRWWFWLGGIAGLVGVAAVTHFVVAGFLPALLRPVSWFWLRPTTDLLPSTGFALTVPGRWPVNVLLCSILSVCWWLICVRSTDHRSSWGPVVVLSAIGLACGHYLWLATWTLAAILPLSPIPRTLVATRRQWLLIAAIAVAAMARPVAIWPAVVQEVLGNGTPTGRLAPAEWPLAGPVMLTNLDRCREWESAELRSQYPLMLNDRWDVFGGIYPRYAALCRDIVESRSDRYLRSDGEWGGYTSWINESQPALLVVDSHRLDDLRQLSMNPHWSVLGIDGQTTMLARSADPRTQQPLLKASSTLYRLEWPGMSGTPLDENVIIAESAQDHRRVALVLAALRLPYAALRVLRSEPSATQPDLEAICELELAHRAIRYAGAPSLIDQSRGISRVRQAQQDGWHRGDLRVLVVRSLATLGFIELARQVAFPEDIGNVPEQTSLSDAASDSAESQLRLGLEQGDLPRCRQLLDQLEPATRLYYTALVNAADNSPDRTADELRQVLGQTDFPERLRGEANFYLGCQAIEAGDPPTAATAFSRSAEIAPESPFASLRSLYLRQIISQ